MKPRFSVVEFTTPMLSFAEDVALYREIGAEGIGIVETKILDEERDLEVLRSSGLQVSSFIPACTSILPADPAELLPGPEDPDARIAAICSSLRRLEPFAPRSCFVATGPVGAFSPDEARTLVVEGVRAAARVASDTGTILAVELLHPSLAPLFGFVHSIADGVALLDEVGEPNTAIALDFWHLDEGPDLLAKVRDNARRFVAVHVNDRRDPTRHWCDRVLPGDGTVDIPGILASLEEGGFDGWFELEVISDDGSVETTSPTRSGSWIRSSSSPTAGTSSSPPGRPAGTADQATGLRSVPICGIVISTKSPGSIVNPCGRSKPRPVISTTPFGNSCSRKR